MCMSGHVSVLPAPVSMSPRKAPSAGKMKVPSREPTWDGMSSKMPGAGAYLTGPGTGAYSTGAGSLLDCRQHFIFFTFVSRGLNDVGWKQASHTALNDMGDLEPQTRKCAVQYHTGPRVSAERLFLMGKT